MTKGDVIVRTGDLGAERLEKQIVEMDEKGFELYILTETSFGYTAVYYRKPE